MSKCYGIALGSLGMAPSVEYHECHGAVEFRFVIIHRIAVADDQGKLPLFIICDSINARATITFAAGPPKRADEKPGRYSAANAPATAFDLIAADGRTELAP